MQLLDLLFQLDDALLALLLEFHDAVVAFAGHRAPPLATLVRACAAMRSSRSRLAATCASRSARSASMLSI
jgi:hypothetical protein